MKKTVSAILLMIALSIGVASATTDANYSAAISAVKASLANEQQELQSLNEVLTKLEVDLGSAKIKKYVAYGVGFPVGLLSGYIALQALPNLAKSSDIYGIGGAITTIIFAGSASTTVLSGTIIYLTHSQVSEIQESIDLVKKQIEIKQELIANQLEALASL